MIQLKYDSTALKAVGRRLKQLRQEYDLSLNQFAELACVNMDNYYRVECGKRNCSIGLIYNIASGLEITPGQIFDKHFVEIYRNMVDERWIREVMDDDRYYLIKRRRVESMLKFYRRKRGVSQTVLAARLEVSRSYLNNFEYGRGGKIKPEMLVGMMKVMHLTAEELLTEIGVILCSNLNIKMKISYEIEDSIFDFITFLFNL